MESAVNILKSSSEQNGIIEIRFPGKTWPQVYAILSASLTMVVAGTSFAWPSPAIPKLLRSELNITITEASFLTIIPSITMITSTPLFCFLLDKIGRKLNLIFTTAFEATSWILIAFANNIYILYVARGFTGLSDSCILVTLPVYIAESVTPKIRNTYGNIMTMSLFLGQFLVNIIGYYTSIQNCAFILLSFPALVILTFGFAPETPYYYAMKGNREKARKSLRRLRGIKEIDVELKQIMEDVARQMSEPNKFKHLWNIKSNRKAMIIANLARLFQQFSGMSGVVVYTQYIFDLAGNSLASGHSAMIFSGFRVVANVLANFVSVKLGRRKSIVISCMGCGFALLSLFIFFYLKSNTKVNVKIVSWFPLVALAFYATSFASGLGVVPGLLIGEVFSTAIRSKAVLTTNIGFAVYLIIVNKLFQWLMTEFGLWVPFLFFSICMFLSGIVSSCIIPETKGKTLEEIQQMLKEGRPLTVATISINSLSLA